MPRWKRNSQAFEMGRWAIVNPEAARRLIEAEVVEKPRTPEEKIAFRETHLTAYQGKRLAKRYRKLVDPIADPRLKEAVAKGYHKLLAYKDEYEVARLHLQTGGQGAGGLRRGFQIEIPPRPADAARQGRRRSPEET